jgi:hypothetical protein
MTFPNPDAVGSAEYRAMYDCLVESEALHEDGTVRDRHLAGAMLDQFALQVVALTRALHPTAPTMRVVFSDVSIGLDAPDEKTAHVLVEQMLRVHGCSFSTSVFASEATQWEERDTAELAP